MTQTPQSLAANITQLVSFPDVALRVDEMLTDEYSSATDIGNLIEQDPALTATLIRIANSAFFNSGVPVDSVRQAVTLVGSEQIRDITLGICARHGFEGIPNDLISPDDFWKHSLCCAVASQLLASHSNMAKTNSAFAAGLLHDIGHLVMFSQCPDLSRRALLLSLDQTDGFSPYLAERHVFGFDHMAAGGELARQWGFPENLRHCIEWHHDPFANNQINSLTLLVHIANSIAVMAELESTNVDDAPPIDYRAFEILRLSRELIPDIVSATRESFADLVRIFVN